ncbi:hypothetical protein FRC15_005865 [Serendipita sp. 397]|nr:hypothetical protein FRC15_005865 [Serendipita sp. 397]
MNARRARAQYGKASKRTITRTNEKIPAEQASDDVILSVEHDALKVPERRIPKPDISKREPPRETKKRTSEPAAVPNRMATSKPSTHITKPPNAPNSPQRKRRRAASRADSDVTDIVDEPPPKIPKRQPVETSLGRKPTMKTEKATPVSVAPNRPDTPQMPRLARDLSDLLISPHKSGNSSINGSPPKKGHLKRMLSSRSKTEPSIPVSEGTTPSGELFQSHSMFNPPLSVASASLTHQAPSFNRNPLARDRTPSPIPRRGGSPPPIAKSPQRPGRTYSKSRSFLIEIPQDTNSMNIDGPGESNPLDLAGKDEDMELKNIHRESYTELRSRWGIENSEQDSAPINDLNSIGEMRSRGETRRFLDEVGYLFDGLDATASNSSAKRASAIEIVSKMGDPDFQRRAAAADFTGRAWKIMRAAGAGSGDDRILDASLIAFVAIATKESHQTHDLLKSKDLITFLGTTVELKGDEDVLVTPPSSQEQIWARRHGLSKVDRTSLAALRAAINNSGILEQDSAISHRLLASMSLLRVSELGQSLDSVATSSILGSLGHELSYLAPEDDSSDEHTYESLDLRHITNCIKLLEHSSILASPTNQDRKRLISGLASLVPAWPTLVQQGFPIDVVGPALEAVLRYLIVLTHDNDAEWCEMLASTPTLVHNLLRLFLRNYYGYFSSPEAMQSKGTKAVDEEEDDSRSRDLRATSLSLGLITQLAKQSTTARKCLRESTMSKDCPLMGNCSRECTCIKRTSGLQCLNGVFNHVHEGLDVHAEAQSHFVQGHIGVLLGYLCVHDPESKRPIIRMLKPQGRPDAEKLRTLINIVREFCTLLTTVIDKAGRQQEVSSQASAHSSSSNTGNDAPALTLGDDSLDEGVQLAQGVIQGLENLL